MPELLEPELEQGLRVRFAPVLKMDDEQLFRFCAQNPELRVERTAAVDLIFMTPESAGSAGGNAELMHQFTTWAKHDKKGRVFGSSAGLILPNRAMRSPDIAWVRSERLETFSKHQWNRFLPLCPDFVLELRSPSDSLRSLKEKMEEHLENGADLGWLLDPSKRTVNVFRKGEPVEVLENPAVVSGEPLLKGFTLDVREVWAATEPPQ